MQIILFDRRVPSPPNKLVAAINTICNNWAQVLWLEQHCPAPLPRTPKDEAAMRHALNKIAYELGKIP